MFDLNIDLGGAHYHKHLQLSDDQNNSKAVKEIIGNGKEWSQEIHGQLNLKATGNRTLLRVSGPNALKVVGTETIQG